MEFFEHARKGALSLPMDQVACEGEFAVSRFHTLIQSMRTLLVILVVVFHWPVCAQTSKPGPPKGEYAPGTKEQDPTAPPVEKPKTFTLTADELIENGFVNVGKDGARTIHKLAKDALVLQGQRRMKFSDLKPSDTVTGLRKKISETDYEIVRITRFVHKPAPKPPKPAEK
jgi:hypothetical protein